MRTDVRYIWCTASDLNTTYRKDDKLTVYESDTDIHGNLSWSYGILFPEVFLMK